MTSTNFPNSAWINFDISGQSLTAHPVTVSLLLQQVLQRTKQLLWRDKTGNVLHCAKLVSHLSSLEADWERRITDGILKFTARFPLLWLSRMCSSAAQHDIERDESFLVLFPYLSNTRTLLGERMEAWGFLKKTQFIEDHDAHYSETLELPFTTHTSSASQ